MEITLGQQYNNVGEKPPVLLYAYINRHAGTLENIVKTKQCSTLSHMVAIINYITWAMNTVQSHYMVFKGKSERA